MQNFVNHFISVYHEPMGALAINPPEKYFSYGSHPNIQQARWPGITGVLSTIPGMHCNWAVYWNSAVKTAMHSSSAVWEVYRSSHTPPCWLCVLEL